MADQRLHHKSVGCLSFLRRRSSTSRRSSEVQKPQSPRIQLSKSTDSLASIASTDGGFNSSSLLDSFAKFYVEKRHRRTTVCSRESRSAVTRTEKLVLMPYFGYFAGQRIVFELRKNEAATIGMKVKIEDKVLATLHHRPGRKETVKDICIKFAHELTSQSSSTSNTQPPRLSFLCEQTVLLHNSELPVHLLPLRYVSNYSTFSQAVDIRVWPRKLHPALIKLKLKPRISTRELQWMLCKRVGLPNPSAMSLYIGDDLEPLPPTSSIPSNCTQLECIIAPLQQRTSCDLSDMSVCVSIIGKGVREVQVDPSMTLYDFETAVKATFCLGYDSFIYLPQVHVNSRSCYGQPCSLKMFAVLDSSSMILLDSERRNFPTLYGFLSACEPQTLQSLLLYQMAVSELDLFKAGPVIGFEVTGPTIPISFKTMQSQSTEDTGVHDARSSIFSVIAVQPHAISVNPEWTMPVLAKYISCVSGFPCKAMRIGERGLIGTVETDILSKDLFTVDNAYNLVSEIPEAIPDFM